LLLKIACLLLQIDCLLLKIACLLLKIDCLLLKTACSLTEAEVAADPQRSGESSLQRSERSRQPIADAVDASAAPLGSNVSSHHVSAPPHREGVGVVGAQFGAEEAARAEESRRVHAENEALKLRIRELELRERQALGPSGAVRIAGTRAFPSSSAAARRPTRAAPSAASPSAVPYLARPEAPAVHMDPCRSLIS